MRAISNLKKLFSKKRDVCAIVCGLLQPVAEPFEFGLLAV